MRLRAPVEAVAEREKEPKPMTGERRAKEREEKNRR
jgi:hypothetical protein